MELSEELRELRDDLFGIGLDDSASREIKLTVISTNSEGVVVFEFKSPTYEENVVEKLVGILLQIKETNFHMLPSPTIERSGVDLLKKFGVHVNGDWDGVTKSIFTLSSAISSKFSGLGHDEYSFKNLSVTLEAFLPVWNLRGFIVEILQKGEWEKIYSYEFKTIFGSTGLSGTTGVTGSAGISGVISSGGIAGGTVPTFSGTANSINVKDDTCDFEDAVLFSP
jgi:hypothetical protein